MPKFEIEPKDFRTEYLEITPQYKMEADYERRDQLLGYEASDTIEVVLRKFGRLDEFVSAAVEAGANTVESISFETTEIRKYQDDARKLAIKAAREKATLLASELGQKIGKARTITEGGREYSGRASRSLSRGNGGGGGMFIRGATEPSAIIAGEISVTSSISVVFDLE